MTSLSKCRRRKDAHLQHVVWLAGGGGWGGGKGKGGVGLMHVYSSCIFNLLFSSILFVVVFFLFFQINRHLYLLLPLVALHVMKTFFWNSYNNQVCATFDVSVFGVVLFLESLFC